MTIRDGKKYLESLWDWGFLDDCFADDIKVTDIDGCVERNGKYLIIETKLPSVYEIPRGQKMMFRRMLKTGMFTVLIIFGYPQIPERCILLKTDKDSWSDFEVTLEEIHDIVSEWFRYSNYK